MEVLKVISHYANIHMKLSDYVIEQLAILFHTYKSGRLWVILMNKYGSNEVYDQFGMPDIGKANGLRPSKTEYLSYWFRKLNGSPEIQSLLEDILNDHSDIINDARTFLQRDEIDVIQVDTKWKLVGKTVDNRQPIINNAHFKDIEQQVINEIDKAVVSIWIAMAWFTNKRIYTKLKEKLADDVDIRMIIYYDATNKKHGVNVKDFNTTFVKRAVRGGIMHDKFCIIDSQTVLTGSYNWSDNAEFKNDENVTVAIDPSLALKYSMEFKRLKKECKIVPDEEIQ